MDKKAISRFLLFLEIKRKSLYRLFKEFPIIIQILTITTVIGIGFILLNIQINLSISYYVIAWVIFVLLGRLICQLSKPEEVLLKILCIPQIPLQILKCLFLSLPFFLLHVLIGLFVITTGTLTILFLTSSKRIKIGALQTFYRPESYQWVSMFRNSGVWILSAGFLFLLIALWHKNQNMACASLGLIICFPSFSAYFKGKDPQDFLRIYKNSTYLMYKKATEALANMLIPMAVCLPIVLFMDFQGYWFYIQCICFFIYVSLLLFYCYYVSYPSIITPLALFAIVSICIGALFINHSILSICISPILLLILHFIAIQNLKRKVYAQNTTIY